MLKTQSLSVMMLVLFQINISQSYQEIENTCKIKAKEIAALSYKNCVTDAKSKELEQIKLDYQKKLQALKGDYEKKLRALTDTKAQNNKTDTLKNANSDTKSENNKSTSFDNTQTETQIIEMPLPTQETQTY